ncbi:MAG: hypothetical protein PHI58_02460 [Candidatus Omnitrophica bacterium]|nr:hypothetical protein [Candidatus Omnitrophota bacterium]
MKITMTNRIISLVVAILFIFNSVAYGLSPMPGSRNEPTQAAMVDMADYLLANASHVRVDFDAVLPINFIPSTGLVPIEGIEIRPGATTDKTPPGWEMPSFLTLAKSRLADSGISNVEVIKGDLRRDVSDAEPGVLPIFKRSKAGGKVTVIFDENFVAMFDGLAKNDIMIDFKDPKNSPRQGQGSTSAASELLKRVTKRVAADDPQEDWLSDAVWMWFLHSYANSNMVRYNNNILAGRIDWIFENDEAAKLKLNDEFKSIKGDPALRQKAKQLALLMNDKYYGERAVRAKAAAQDTTGMSAVVAGHDYWPELSRQSRDRILAYLANMQRPLLLGRDYNVDGLQLSRDAVLLNYIAQRIKAEKYDRKEQAMGLVASRLHELTNLGPISARFLADTIISDLSFPAANFGFPAKNDGGKSPTKSRRQQSPESVFKNIKTGSPVIITQGGRESIGYVSEKHGDTIRVREDLTNRYHNFTYQSIATGVVRPASGADIDRIKAAQPSVEKRSSEVEALIEDLDKALKTRIPEGSLEYLMLERSRDTLQRDGSNASDPYVNFIKKYLATAYKMVDRYSPAYREALPRLADYVREHKKLIADYTDKAIINIIKEAAYDEGERDVFAEAGRFLAAWERIYKGKRTFKLIAKTRAYAEYIVLKWRYTQFRLKLLGHTRIILDEPSAGKPRTRPGKSAEAALIVLAHTPELQNEPFSVADYLDKGYAKFVKEHPEFRFDAPAENRKSALQTARRDLLDLAFHPEKRYRVIRELSEKGPNGSLLFRVDDPAKLTASVESGASKKGTAFTADFEKRMGEALRAEDRRAIERLVVENPSGAILLRTFLTYLEPMTRESANWPRVFSIDQLEMLDRIIRERMRIRAQQSDFKYWIPLYKRIEMFEEILHERIRPRARQNDFKYWMSLSKRAHDKIVASLKECRDIKKAWLYDATLLDNIARLTKAKTDDDKNAAMLLIKGRLRELGLDPNKSEKVTVDLVLKYISGTANDFGFAGTGKPVESAVTAVADEDQAGYWSGLTAQRQNRIKEGVDEWAMNAGWRGDRLDAVLLNSIARLVTAKEDAEKAHAAVLIAECLQGLGVADPVNQAMLLISSVRASGANFGSEILRRVPERDVKTVTDNLGKFMAEPGYQAWGIIYVSLKTAAMRSESGYEIATRIGSGTYSIRNRNNENIVLPSELIWAAKHKLNNIDEIRITPAVIDHHKDTLEFILANFRAILEERDRLAKVNGVRHFAIKIDNVIIEPRWIDAGAISHYWIRTEEEKTVYGISGNNKHTYLKDDKNTDLPTPPWKTVGVSRKDVLKHYNIDETAREDLDITRMTIGLGQALEGLSRFPDNDQGERVSLTSSVYKLLSSSKSSPLNSGTPINKGDILEINMDEGPEFHICTEVSGGHISVVAVGQYKLIPMGAERHNYDGPRETKVVHVSGDKLDHLSELTQEARDLLAEVQTTEDVRRGDKVSAAESAHRQLAELENKPRWEAADVISFIRLARLTAVSDDTFSKTSRWYAFDGIDSCVIISVRNIPVTNNKQVCVGRYSVARPYDFVFYAEADSIEPELAKAQAGASQLSDTDYFNENSTLSMREQLVAQDLWVAGIDHIYSYPTDSRMLLSLSWVSNLIILSYGII